MPIVFKLVGNSIDGKYYEIHDNFEGPITLKMIYALFQHFGITESELENVRFIAESQQLKNPDKVILVRSEEDKVILIFISDLSVRSKFQQLFMSKGIECNVRKEPPVEMTQPPGFEKDESLSEPVTEVKLEIKPVLTPEIIDNINIKTVKLFDDADFKILFSIYLKRPELFNTLSKYVQNGTIVQEALIPVKELTEAETEQYKVMAAKINELGFNLPEETIMTKLIQYNGHMNLSVRSILCDLNGGS
jgi:hypothetical protein